MEIAGKLLLLLVLGVVSCGELPSPPETQDPAPADTSAIPAAEPEVTQTFQKPGAPMIPQEEAKQANSVDHGDPVANVEAVSMPPTPPSTPRQPAIPAQPTPVAKPTVSQPTAVQPKMSQPAPTPTKPDSRATPATPEKISAGPECRSAFVLDLTPSELVDYLKKHTYSCIRFFWTYDSLLAPIFSDANMNRVSEALGDAGKSFDGTNSQNVFELFTFVRSGYYHKFYSNVPFRRENTRVATLEALQVFGENRVIREFSASGGVLVEWVQTIDGASLGKEFLSTLKIHLKQFHSEKSRWNSHEQRNAAYSILYLFSRGFKKMTDREMVEILTDYSLDPDLARQHPFLANNAIWALGRIYNGLPSWKGELLAILTRVYDTHEEFSEPSLWAVKVLTERAKCAVLSDLRRICRSDYATRLEAKLFPNEFHFDDSALVFRTSLPYEELLPLYQASKQVTAQFKRITLVTEPLPKDPNARLTVILYGSLQEYQKYQSFLYDLTADNGGIYIEQKGTFYTYQRSRRESVYTLEELFRHEYVHYLVGRYLVDGMWGSSPLYGNGRMNWFDEGIAEFLTGSTASQGIAPRRSLAARLTSSSRVTPAQIFASRYSNGFEWYRYAGFLFNYLYEQNMGLLRQLLDEVRASDVSGFDAWVDSGRRDAGLQTIYFSYLDGITLSLPVLKDPATKVTDWSGMGEEDLDALSDAFKTVAGHPEVDCRVAASVSAGRFLCFGELNRDSVGRNPDTEEVWLFSDQELNQMMEALAGMGSLDHFKDMTCWMDGDFHFYCEGPLGLSALRSVEPAVQPTTHLSNPAPVTPAQLQKDFWSTRLGKWMVCFPVGNRIECASVISTGLRPKGTPQDTLRADFQKTVETLQNSVRDVRPIEYADLACKMNTTVWKTIPWIDGVYSAGIVNCTFSN